MSASQTLGGPSRCGRVLGPYLDKIIKNAAWRKHSHLVSACKSTLDVLELLSDSPSPDVASPLFGLSSSHADSLLQPLILALDSAYVKVVEPVLDCAFNLFSLNLICAEIDRPSPSSNNTSFVYKMIDGFCRSVGLGEEAIELGVLRVLLSAIRFPGVLIRGDSLVHVVRTCYNVYLGGLNGIKSLWGILDPLAFEEGILERYLIFLDPILNHISDWLEGYLVRKMMLGLAFGAFLDPVADKLMVAATLVLLCTRPVEIPMFGQVPWLWAVPSILQIGKKRFVHYLFDILPLKVVFKPIDRGGKINPKSKVPFHIPSIRRPQEEFSIMVNNSN